MAILFWASLIFLFYIFIGYPLVLLVCRSAFGRGVYKRAITPDVTVLLVARNERDQIESRLQNLMESDYPSEKLQIVVSIDGATDGTEQVVRKYENLGVVMVYSNRHVGKAAAINRAMEQATGEIIVFADARQSFAPWTIRELVHNFADPTVGGVTGELMLMDQDGEAADGVGMYWRYEKAIRALESRVDSVVGATGAVYAIRRALFEPLPEKIILDDVLIPMRIVMSGNRVVFEPNAKAYDVVSCCPQAEYRRKVRTLAGNYQLFAMTPKLLLPVWNPIVWQLWSHKIGRLGAPFALAALFVTNALLVDSTLYAVLFAGQSVFYGCAVMGFVESIRQDKAATAQAAPVVDDHRRIA